MRKHTFIVYTDSDKIYGYLFGVTRIGAQETVEKINKETGRYHYYMEANK